MIILQDYRDKLIALDNFKNSLNNQDRKLINFFEIILTDKELEIRGGTVKQQSRLIKSRFRMQNIATHTLNVEIAIYGSAFSFQSNDRIGIFS